LGRSLAAHIIGDSKPHGRAIVPNGLALCKIHHVAYDRNIIGVRPDLVVQVREDVLAEEDGPMLKHGIQEMHGGKLRVVPRVKAARPEEGRLEERYAEFVAYEPPLKNSNLL
jgi:putative restriction endonuclease